MGEWSSGNRKEGSRKDGEGRKEMDGGRERASESGHQKVRRLGG